MKYFLIISVIFFIFVVFAFPDLSFERQVGISCIFGFFGYMFNMIEYHLVEIRKKLNEKK